MRTEDPHPSTSPPTDPETVPLRRLGRARAVRRITITALAFFVVAGIFGIFGYRTGSVSASGAGYELELSYPSVGRPGVSIQWILHIHHDGGLPSKLTVATSIGYLDILDMNDIEPQPEATTTTGSSVLWTFSAPSGDDMTILVDAFISNNAHRGAAATTSVIESGVAMAEVSYQTRVAP